MSLFRESFAHIHSLPREFWVAICSTFINSAGNMAFVFMVIYLNQHLNYTLTEASTIFAALSLSMLCISMFGGSLIDKLGPVRAMLISLSSNGLILLFMPHISRFSTMLAASIVWGLAFGFYRPASQTFISYLSSAGKHKVTFSVFRLAINLGMSIGPAIGGYLAAHSFPMIFYANAIANFVAVIILFLGLAHSPWRTYSAKKAMGHKTQLSIKWLKSDLTLRLFIFASLPVAMIFFQHESTLPIFLHRDLHLPLTFYGLLFTINTLMIVVCELPLNIATINWPYRINMMLGSFLITAGFAGLYFVTTPTHVIILTIVWTIGEMILYPASSSYIADIAPEEHRGSYMGLQNAASNFGILFGPWLGAILMQHVGAAGLWVICGLWGLVSVALFASLKDPVTNTAP